VRGRHCDTQTNNTVYVVVCVELNHNHNLSALIRTISRHGATLRPDPLLFPQGTMQASPDEDDMEDLMNELEVNQSPRVLSPPFPPSPSLSLNDRACRGGWSPSRMKWTFRAHHKALPQASRWRPAAATPSWWKLRGFSAA
jgi:hypothetical protein